MIFLAVIQQEVATTMGSSCKIPEPLTTKALETLEIKTLNLMTLEIMETLGIKSLAATMAIITNTNNLNKEGCLL